MGCSMAAVAVVPAERELAEVAVASPGPKHQHVPRALHGPARGRLPGPLTGVGIRETPPPLTGSHQGIPHHSPGRPAQPRARLPQPSARQGAGLSVEDARNTNQGDARHQPARHPSAPRLPSPSPRRPNHPSHNVRGNAQTGEPRKKTLICRRDGGRDDPRAGAGLSPAPKHLPGVQPPQPVEWASARGVHTTSQVFRKDKGPRTPMGSLAAGHPGTARMGAWERSRENRSLPSQAGSAAPFIAFAYTGIFLRSHN